MIKATGVLQSFRLNLDGYRAALHQQMQREIKAALVVWLKAVIAEIPDWSGGSRATLTALADAVAVTVPMGSGVGPDTPDRTAQGEAASSESGVDFAGPTYTFTYQTNLRWLLWNNAWNANENPDRPYKWRHVKLKNPGPYGFDEKGLAAFRQYAEDLKSRIPSVSPFVETTDIKLG